MDENVNNSHIKKLVLLVIFSICIIAQVDFKNLINKKKLRILNDDVLTRYHFINNITSNYYKGKWNSFNNYNYLLDNINGNIQLEIGKNLTYIDFLNNIDNSNSLELLFIANDGLYRDKWMSFNVSFSLPKINISNNEIAIMKSNLSLVYNLYDLFDIKETGKCNKTNLSMNFIKNEKILIKGFDSAIAILFSKINGKIFDEECKFSIDFNLDLLEDIDKTDRVWNYSLILTSISVLEIYFTTKILYEVAENTQTGRNICLITLIMNIIWNSIICTSHFLLSITHQNYSYEYGITSMSYFLLFSIFELKLLFLVWKSRNIEYLYNNPVEFKKKLFRFYTLFYILLLIGSLSINFIFNNFWSSYIVFSSTWIFQIFHNAYHGTKPPYSLHYMITLTVGKLFLPLYLKACPGNLFELEPKYFKMFIITITVCFEILIIELQKIISPKFFIPRWLKRNPYNYYHDLSNDIIKNNNYNSECVICLDIMLKQDIKNEINKESITYQKMSNKLKLWMESLKKSYISKPYMITPCKHVFHTECLESWMNMKNECPYCRRPIPPIE